MANVKELKETLKKLNEDYAVISTIYDNPQKIQEEEVATSREIEMIENEIAKVEPLGA